MRYVLLFLVFALPAHAWEVTIGPTCTLTHEMDSGVVRLTYDPRIPEYSITVTRSAMPWAADAPMFAMRFDGPNSGMITTDRHVLSDGGTSLTVTDRGFGNVLDGLQFNNVATALLGNTAVVIPLANAAEPVARFRACAALPTA
jgi:hypothetical protein